MPIDQISKGDAGASDSLTIDDTTGGIGFTTASITVGKHQSTKVVATAETAQMRFTIDGTAPTSTAGHLLEIGDVLTVEGPSDVLNFKAIRTGSTSGALYCTYFR